MEAKMASPETDEIPNIIETPSVLGPQWCGTFEIDVEFGRDHFETAMSNLIKQPNINSTVILRADILKDLEFDDSGVLSKETVDTKMIAADLNIPLTSGDQPLLTKNLSDVEIRDIPSSLELVAKSKVMRRMIPRNPFKDCVMNQTCLVLRKGNDISLVTYIPHIDTADDCPFYLPPVEAVGILFNKGKLSVHYLPFGHEDPDTVAALRSSAPQDRPIRIAYRLLKTAARHSAGVMNGYKKRVNHDQVVSKVAFQDRYIALKKKYSRHFLNNWAESTDPRKHVFEDLAIAAFLIQYWTEIYPDKECFEFRDLGCGNGLLVYILIMEGYHGVGIDARTRKSWKTYPEEVQAHLKEQVIIPSVLLRPHPAYRNMVSDNGRIFQIPIGKDNFDKKGGREMPMPIDAEGVPVMAYYSSANLLSSPQVNVAEFPKSTFIIGNHSDELTCWIPLLGHPFLVIPCCSHNLGGARVRYTSRRYPKSSTYAGLCEKVEMLSSAVGWKIQTEMLRIPSTRNMAIIGQEKTYANPLYSVYDILAMEGGAEGWVENAMALMKKAPRNH